MKLGWKYATQAWGYHVVAMLLGFFFVANMGGSWFGLAVNALLLLSAIGLALNNGAYQGEKACTTAATIEKLEADGRKVDESLRSQVFNRRVAAWILIFGCLPFLLVSTANLISQPFYQESEMALEEMEKKADEAFSMNFDQAETADISMNPFNVAARIVFMPYVSVYTLVDRSTLNMLFVLFSLPIPSAMAAGYLAGPRMRRRKLHDIALGKKRKMRRLKVNKKPRAPKAEV